MNEHIAEAKISSRGQIAIPKKIKDMLKIEDGDYIIFEKKGNDICIKIGKIVLK